MALRVVFPFCVVSIFRGGSSCFLVSISADARQMVPVVQRCGAAPLQLYISIFAGPSVCSAVSAVGVVRLFLLSACCWCPSCRGAARVVRRCVVFSVTGVGVCSSCWCPSVAGASVQMDSVLLFRGVFCSAVPADVLPSSFFLLPASCFLLPSSCFPSPALILEENYIIISTLPNLHVMPSLI